MLQRLTAFWRQTTWTEVFVVCMGIVVAVDLVLVFTGHMSISMRTWIATELHPTLIAFGMLVGVGVGYL